MFLDLDGFTNWDPPSDLSDQHFTIVSRLRTECVSVCYSELTDAELCGEDGEERKRKQTPLGPTTSVAQFWSFFWFKDNWTIKKY